MLEIIIAFLSLSDLTYHETSRGNDVEYVLSSQKKELSIKLNFYINQGCFIILIDESIKGSLDRKQLPDEGCKALEAVEKKIKDLELKRKDLLKKKDQEINDRIINKFKDLMKKR